LVFPISF